VIDERDLHTQKQYSQIFSTEEGIQIDESDEQSENVNSSIHESSEPLSNITLETVLQSAKQPPLSFRIRRQIITSHICPKYRIIEIPSKSTIKFPFTLKLSLPSSI
jgi:hypothetical protein